jgi:hypothetical protein
MWGSGSLPPCLFFFISPISIYRNAGTEVIQRLHDLPSWAFNRYFSTEQMPSQKILTNTDPDTYLASSALAAGATHSYFITMANNLVQFAGMALDKLNGDLKLTCEFNRNGCIGSGTGT